LGGNRSDWPLLNTEQAHYCRLDFFGNSHNLLLVFVVSVGASTATSIGAQQNHTVDRNCYSTAALVALVVMQVIGSRLAPPAPLLQENHQRGMTDASLSRAF
jgi:hypothetical protein